MKPENVDALTGLANWKYVRGILPGILGHNGQVALILIDINRFKAFQDFHGREKGTAKLKEIARAIADCCGSETLVFRFGGDEFGAILYEASLEQARELAEEIRAQHTPVWVEVGGKTVSTNTLSLGIAHFPTHVSSAEDLIVAADLALLKARQDGRLSDGTAYVGENRVMAIGDFVDEFPEQSAKFLN